MTKKDFILISDVIREISAWALEKRDSRITYFAIVNALSRELQEENPRFDPNKFRTACGIVK